MLTSILRVLNKFEVLLALLVAVLAAGAAFAVVQYGGGLVLGLLVLLIAGIIVFFVIYNEPAWGAFLILALAPFEGYLDFGGQSAVRLATVLCVGILGMQVLLTKRSLNFDRPFLLSLALVGWALVTIAWSSDKSHSLSNWLSFALQSLLYFIIMNLILSLKGLKMALWGLVLGGIVLSLVFINLMVTRDFLRNQDFLGLGVNLASRLIGMNLLFSLLLFQMEKNPIGRIVLLLSAIASAIGVVIAGSRGTWIGVTLSFAALVSVYIAGKQIRISFRQILLWSLIVIAVLFVLNTYVLNTHGAAKLTDRFQSGVTLSDSAGGRFQIWEVAWRVFKSSPFLGHGFDTFPDQFLRYAQLTGLSNYFHVNEAKQPHNAYVEISAELGLIGLFLFLAVIGSVLRAAWKLWNDSPVNISALAWALALLVYIFIASMVDSAATRKYFWYTLGLVTLLIQYWKTERLATSASASLLEEAP